jgi:hypothetical protein
MGPRDVIVRNTQFTSELNVIVKYSELHHFVNKRLYPISYGQGSIPDRGRGFWL